ncbi:MAG TPA: hypothetical protein VK629_16570 [Steroidobacteraceae bacterium]|nr:hypothetical protein [Steroidobacteraceae bacterium]
MNTQHFEISQLRHGQLEVTGDDDSRGSFIGGGVHRRVIPD